MKLLASLERSAESERLSHAAAVRRAWQAQWEIRRTLLPTLSINLSLGFVNFFCQFKAMEMAHENSARNISVETTSQTIIMHIKFDSLYVPLHH